VAAGQLTLPGVEERTWTAMDGRTLEGTLRKANELEVELVVRGGRAWKVPLNRLSDADREYVHAYLRERYRDQSLRIGPYKDQVAGEWVKAEPPGGLRYQIFGGSRLRGTERYPLVVYLHGAGGRGDDNERQLEHGARTFAAEENYRDRECIVVAPQCPAEENWGGANGEAVIALIDDLTKNLPIDAGRIYLTGYSMGGYGTWSLLARYPDKFAAAVPVAGGGDPGKAETFSHVPVWAFHGSLDTDVPPERSREMIEALEEAGGEPKFTEYEGLGHGSAGPAYSDQELHRWLFEQRRG
jgi:predicted peptidase